MPANLENSAVATELEKSVLITIPKKGKSKNVQTTIQLYSFHMLGRLMLKILQAGIQQYMNRELPDVQAGFRKAEEPEIKLPTSVGSLKKQENSRNTSTYASLTMLKPLTV